MGHTHLKAIETWRSYNYHKRQNENRIDPIFSWMLIQSQPKNFPEGNKKWKLYNMTKLQQSTLAEASTS